jgi:hypothetical protein
MIFGKDRRSSTPSRLASSTSFSIVRDRLLLYSGIYRNSLEIFGVDRLSAVGHREALLQQGGDLLLTQPLAPARERRAINGSSCRNTTSPQNGCPAPTRHTELKRRARKFQSISPASRTSG